MREGSLPSPASTNLTTATRTPYQREKKGTQMTHLDYAIIAAIIVFVGVFIVGMIKTLWMTPAERAKIKAAAEAYEAEQRK